MAVEGKEWLEALVEADRLLATNKHRPGPWGKEWFKSREKADLDQARAADLWQISFLIRGLVRWWAASDGYDPVYRMRVHLDGTGREYVLQKFRTYIPGADAREALVTRGRSLTDTKSEADFNDPRKRPGAICDFIRRHSLDDLQTLEQAKRGEIFLFGPRLLTQQDTDLAITRARNGDRNAAAYLDFLNTLGIAGAVSLPELTVRHRASLDQRLKLMAMHIEFACRVSDDVMHRKLRRVPFSGKGK